MKKLFAIIAAASLCACASPPTPTSVDVRKGMTEAQIEARYGKPQQIQQRADGTLWYYSHMTAGVPMVSAYQNKGYMGIVFGTDGRVRDFQNNGY